ADAQKVWGEARLRAVALGDDRTATRIDLELGFVLNAKGELEAARPLFARALAGFERAGRPPGQALAWDNLALPDPRRGELEPARAGYERALALFQEAGDARAAGVVEGNLGGIAQVEGEPALAIARFAEAARRQRELGDAREEARALGNLGTVLS